MKTIDTLAIGTCYVDTNVSHYPFDSRGIPAETELVGEEYEMVPGGSAVNSCRLLGKLGLKTAFMGMAGNDGPGELLERLLQDEGIEPRLIHRDDLQTNVSFNMTGKEGAHIMCVAGTANAALSPKDVLPRLDEVMPDVRTLYLGGCFKLKSFGGAFGEILDMAATHQTEVVVDHNRVPEGASPEMLESVKKLVLGANYYFPSRDEFSEVWDVEDPEEGLRKLRNEAPQLIVVVKDGANGAYHLEGNEVVHTPSEYVEVANATGAGDSFNAGVMVALDKGCALADAVNYGCAVARAKISGQEPPRLAA